MTEATKQTTSTSRVAKMREEAKARGWVRREYYATPGEHEKLRAALDKLRRRRPKTAQRGGDA